MQAKSENLENPDREIRAPRLNFGVVKRLQKYSHWD